MQAKRPMRKGEEHHHQQQHQPRVEQLIKDDIDFTSKSVNQYDLPAYYKVNYKQPDRPIITCHGLANYSGAVKLGDSRIRYETSFTHDCFHPPISEHRVDYGLTDDMVKENRRRDYDYALKMTGKGDLDAIERIMTEKLTQRSKAGVYPLRQVFKYFDRTGSGCIQLAECRKAFQLMGFSFSETQVTALFAQLDTDLKGEIRYQGLLSRLVEKDFLEVKPIWLQPSPRPTAQGGHSHEGEPPRIQDEREAEYHDDVQQSLAMEEEEVRKLFNLVNNDGTGCLDRDGVTVLLIVLGIKFDREKLDELVNEVMASLPHQPDARHQPQRVGVDFEAFWTWWLGHNM